MRCSSFCVAVIMASAGLASASLTPYSGFDRVGTASTAGAAAALGAESAWLQAAGGLGTVHTADMESLTPGVTGTSFVIAPGVTMSLQFPWRPGSLTVEDSASHRGPSHGFNSTLGGANHMLYESTGGNVLQPEIQLDFAQPIAAFSLFITGEGTSGILIGDHNSTRLHVGGNVNPVMHFGDHGYPYWPSRAQPNVKFGGFVDPTASISRIVIEPRFLSTDGHGTYSFDDLRWVPAPVPAPGAAALLALGGICAGRPNRRS